MSLTRVAGLVAGLCVAVPGTARSQDSLHVVVVSTTDIHGRVTSWDFINDREGPWGLDRARARWWWWTRAT
jgi:hypothetical protein